jgi:oligoendopeptidase F
MKQKPEWNLKLLYKNEHDPQIEKDMRSIERACAAFEKKYKGKGFVKNPRKLAGALREYEQVQKLILTGKPWWYFALLADIRSGYAKADAEATKFDQRLTAARNKVQFFYLDIGKTPVFLQKKYLTHPSLRSYAYQLKRIFSRAAHYLSDPEEQLINALDQTSYAMWVRAQEKNLNNATIVFGNKNIPLNAASQMLPTLPKQRRTELQKKINSGLQSLSGFAEAELNAVYNYKKITDERRKYPKPYSETVRAYENDEKTVEQLVRLVSGRFDISRRFYKLHAKLLKLKKLGYEDRSAEAGTVKSSFSFSQSCRIVRAALERVHPQYAHTFDGFLEHGQIDAFPRKGKHGGAYCWGSGNLPTFVLLNHAGSIVSVETLGHEMGHAIHGELSKHLPPHYQGHSIATAEVASTFFEQVTSEEIEKHLSEKEKILFLHNKILGDIVTIFRQIACFNFEQELHARIRAEGQLSKEKIAELMAQHLRSYTGSAMHITPQDGYTFVSWSHIRSFFYVYTYAYGQLVSKALFKKWKENPLYAKKIEQFMRAGRSASPENIFKSIGINTSKPEFFKLGLASIEENIGKLEKLL